MARSESYPNYDPAVGDPCPHVRCVATGRASRRRETPRLAGHVVLLLGVSIFAQSAIAQQTVTELRFEGLVNSTQAYVRSIVQTSEGSPFDETVAAEDVARLEATRKFSSASYRSDATAGGVAITFVVTEIPSVSSISFTGNVKFSDKVLLKKIDVKEGAPLDTFAARQGAETILEMYREEGYGQAVVGYDDALLRETGELLYRIEEGPRFAYARSHSRATTASTRKNWSSR